MTAGAQSSTSFLSSKPRLIASVFVLLGLVVLWVAMAEVAQAMQRGCGEGQDKPYYKPYTVTYVIHVGYVLCLVVAVVWTMIEQFCCVRASSGQSNIGNVDAVLERTPLLSNSNSGQNKVDSSNGSGSEGSINAEVKRGYVHGVNWRAWRIIIAKIAFMALFVNFVGYTYYRSLPLIDVSANVAIYNSSSAFVYIFSLMLRMEHLSWLKVLSILISIAGVCLVQFLAAPPAVTTCPGPTPAPTPAAAVSGATEGYILVVLSTMTYALYEVIYKRWLSPSVYRDAALPPAPPPGVDDPTPTVAIAEPKDVSLWSDVKYSFVTLGMIGLLHMILCWPGILILDATGVETFELPEQRALESLMVTTVMDSMFNVLLLIGIAITSPLFIAVGCLLTMPASILSDWMLHGHVMSGGSLGGVACIAVGFFVLTYSEVRDERARRKAVAEANSVKNN